MTVPPGVVSTTSTRPAAWFGVVTVAVVAVLAVTVAGWVPKSTWLVLSRSVPVMVTTVPPSGVPTAGDTVVIAGTFGPVMSTGADGSE